MRHRDDAEAARRPKPGDRLDHQERVGWIERRGRLVEQERLGIAQQRPGHRHPLLLATGERGRVPVEQIRLEADLGQHRAQPVLREIASNICRTDAEVLAHRPLEQHRRLHDERDPAPSWGETRRAYSPPWATSVSWEPVSTTRPASRTMI